MPTAKAKDGTKLYYKDWGEGRPVVLLHGWPLTGDTFDAAGIALVEQGFRVIIPDRRGFGRSDKSWGGNEYDTYTDDVAEILDDAGIDGKIAIVGFSMGGGEVARFQSRYPGRTAAAVLIASIVPYLAQADDHPEGVPADVFAQMSSGMKDDHHEFFRGFFKDFYGAGAVSDAVLDHSQQLMGLASIHNIRAAANAFATTDFRADLENFGDIPVLVIHGDADQTVPIDITARAVKRALPHAELKEYAGSAHGLLETDKQRVIDDVVGFLAGVGDDQHAAKTREAEKAD